MEGSSSLLDGLTLFRDCCTVNVQAVRFFETSVTIYLTGFEVLTAVKVKIKFLRNVKVTSIAWP